MIKDTEKAQVAFVCPSPFGYAVFMSCPSKTFVIYMDRTGGSNIEKAMGGEKGVRPLSHELMLSLLDSMDCSVEYVLIGDTNEGTFYSTIRANVANELGTKIIEVDARPSDSVSLALRANAPVYVSKNVLEKVNDTSEILAQLKG